MLKNRASHSGTVSILMLLPMLLLFASCRSAEKSPDRSAAENKAAWSEQMQKMAKSVHDLIPYLFDREAFSAPQNKEVITGILKDFSEHAHKITPQMGQPLLGDDPLVSFSIDNLETDLGRAYQAFELNQYEYARTVAKSSLNHCFRCHSLTQIGAAAHWDLTGINRLHLNPIDYVDLLVASRKYDDALKYMEGLISSKDYLQDHPFDYESVLRRYLALVIRASMQPSRALTEMDSVAARTDVPSYILEQVEGWRASLRGWIKETEHSGKKKAPPPLKLARELIHRATHLQQYPQDHAGDVEYLRATMTLHDFVQKNPGSEPEAEALSLLGRAYEVLDELGSWNLHEVYYEACIRKAPKTEVAKSCYARLEANVLQGYSGSAGTHIPAFERDKLKTLKDML